MRVWILGAILALLVCVQQVRAHPPKTTFEVDQIEIQQIFRDACRISEYECSGVDTPVVRRSDQLNPMHVYGLYAGGNILWINNQVIASRRTLTMFHEVIHYLQFNVGKLNPDLMGEIASCVVEHEAMELTNKYAIESNMLFYVRQLDEWQETYGC